MHVHKLSHIIPAFSLAGYKSSNTMKELHRDDFDELAMFAKSIPDIISRYIERKNIAAGQNQITTIHRLFLGFYSNDSCIFRPGDAVLMLEIAKFVRSKFEGNEYNIEEEYSFFFDIEHAAKRSKTTKTPVGELFTPDEINFEENETINEDSNRNDGNLAKYLFITHGYE